MEETNELVILLGAVENVVQLGNRGLLVLAQCQVPQSGAGVAVALDDCLVGVVEDFDVFLRESDGETIVAERGNCKKGL